MDETEERIKKIKNLNLIIKSPLITRALELYEKGNKDALSLIDDYLKKTGLDVLLEVSEDTNFLEGEINLGISKKGLPINISLEDLNQNALIVAPSGHGKTNLLRYIIGQVYKLKQVVVFDNKDNFVDMAGMMGGVVIDSSFRINLLKKPSFLDEHEFVMFLADLFSDSLSLLTGSRGYLIELLDKYKDSKSLKEFALNVINEKEQNEYYNVIKGRILALSKVPFFNGKEIDIDSLLDKNIIIRLSHFGNVEQKLIFNYLVYLLYLKGMKKREGFKGLIFIDDAHNLLDVNQERVPEQGLPAIHFILSRIRELGYGFVISNQQISTLISAALSNSFVKILGPLNAEEIKKYDLPNEISSLERGEFLIIKGPYKDILTTIPLPTPKFNEEDLSLLQDLNKNKLGISEFGIEDLANVIFSKIKNKYPISISKLKEKFVLVFSDKEFSEAIKLLEDRKMIKRIYISSSVFSKVEYLIPYDVDEIEGKKLALQKLAYKKIKRAFHDFVFDGEGFVIYKPKLIYVAIMKSGADIARLVKTNFYKVYDIIDSPLYESDVLEFIDPIDIPRIELCRIYNFDIKV